LLLHVDGVSKFFGGVAAVMRVTISVLEGEAVGLMGPNGAGKTTLLKVVGGELKPDTGRIIFRGHDVTGLKPHELCRMGVARTSQIPQPFQSMSVKENLLVAALYGKGLSLKDSLRVAEEILALTGLDRVAHLPAGSLGEIDLKRLELARALATQPRLLLLDEIAAGLTEEEVPEVLSLLREIRSRGITYLLVEHVLKILVEAVDRVVVMNEGEVILEGDPASVMKDERVIDIYFGSDEYETPS